MRGEATGQVSLAKMFFERMVFHLGGRESGLAVFPGSGVGSGVSARTRSTPSFCSIKKIKSLVREAKMRMGRGSAGSRGSCWRSSPLGLKDLTSVVRGV